MINKQEVLKQLGVEKLSKEFEIFEDEGLLYFNLDYALDIAIDCDYDVVGTKMKMENVEDDFMLYKTSWERLIYLVFCRRFVDEIKALSGFELNYNNPECVVEVDQHKNSFVVVIKLEFVKEVKTNEECAESITKIQNLLNTKVDWDEVTKRPKETFLYCPSKYPTRN